MHEGDTVLYEWSASLSLSLSLTRRHHSVDEVIHGQDSISIWNYLSRTFSVKTPNEKLQKTFFYIFVQFFSSEKLGPVPGFHSRNVLWNTNANIPLSFLTWRSRSFRGIYSRIIKAHFLSGLEMIFFSCVCLSRFLFDTMSKSRVGAICENHVKIQILILNRWNGSHS